MARQFIYHMSGLNKAYGNKKILENIHLSFYPDAKIGILGPNGAGKSTVLKIMAGLDKEYTGEAWLAEGATCGYLPQEPELDPSKDVLGNVMEGVADKKAIIDRYNELMMNYSDETADEGAKLQDIIDSQNLWDLESQVEMAMEALRCPPGDADVTKLSGGEKRRVALCKILLSKPDLLLLDEPTNYLDLEGVLWLVDYVKRYPHTVIIISHDRDLLNSATSSIMHLDQKKISFWRGNYDQFERQRHEMLELQQKAHARQEAHRKHMESFVERFRAKATKARQAQSRLKALQKLKPIELYVESHVQPFRFPDAEKKAASPIIALDGADVGYVPGKPVLRNVTLRIDNDDRIALLGSNGNGKSTLAKLIAGRLAPEKGTLTISPNLKVAFFAQHQLDDLVPEDNAIEHVRKLMPAEPEARVRARVAQMGLSTGKMLTPAKDLSGGEKARLLMGLATFHGPNLLILDEPTNHLDIDSREELVHALNAFNGAVILIAHDRHLIEATMERLWLVREGGVKPFEGDLDEYRQIVLADAKGEPAADRDEGPKVNKAEQRKLAAQKREALAPLQKKIKETESLIQKLQKQIQDFSMQLEDPALYEKEPQKAIRINKDMSDAKSTLAEAEDKWLELSAEYEEAMAE